MFNSAPVTFRLFMFIIIYANTIHKMKNISWIITLKEGKEKAQIKWQIRKVYSQILNRVQQK